MGKYGTIITQTPFRVSFFGGGTDMPSYFKGRPGAVLGTTINKYTYVVLNSLERLLEKKIRLSYSKLEMVDSPEELEHELVRQVLTNHKSLLNGGFIDMHSFADLPHSSGVGSSSCFVVGLLNALYKMYGIYRSPHDIAREAITVEREQLGHSGGWQDQIHAAFGGFNRIDFYENSFKVSPIPVLPQRLQALEESCLLYFTGVRRSSAEVTQKTYHAPLSGKSSQEDYLARMYGMVDQGMRILMDAPEKELVHEFGSLLHEAWECKRSLSDSVSAPMIDEIYQAGLKAGASGGKLLGAGGGGCILFIVRPESRANVMEALSPLSRIQVKFERFGTRSVFTNS